MDVKGFIKRVRYIPVSVSTRIVNTWKLHEGNGSSMESELGLWSVLSTAATVNKPPLRTGGQTSCSELGKRVE